MTVVNLQRVVLRSNRVTVVAQVDVGSPGSSWRFERTTLRGLLGCAHAECDGSLFTAGGGLDEACSLLLVAVGCRVNRVFGVSLRPGVLTGALWNSSTGGVDGTMQLGRMLSRSCLSLTQAPCSVGSDPVPCCASSVGEACQRCFVIASHDLRSLPPNSLEGVWCYQRILMSLRRPWCM
jgi:hypothetical protein